MQELIEKLKSLHGLSHDQAHGILNTIKDFVKQKFPMVAGALDNIFPQAPAPGTDTDVAQAVAGTTPAGDTGSTEGSDPKGGSFLDKISDFIPGEAGEKAEDFAKDKLGGMFGNKPS